MPRPWALSSTCLAALMTLSCSPATQAALIPQLHVGLRSSRTHAAYDAASSTPAQRAKQRWDLAVFANLAWTSQRSAALIPSRLELSPDAWLNPCADQDCLWDVPDEDAEWSSSSTEGSP